MSDVENGAALAGRRQELAGGQAQRGVEYFVTGPSLDGRFGIGAVDCRREHCAASMPFLRTREDAEQLAAALNERQTSISDFCQAFAEERLTELV